ncbi:MAG: PQQ-binding-like beta-propeller repeat protein [Planctomycetota bacterium]|nr:PQQ-binding-like beta-propeller repeat protein [Planctomycetota bacterium]
MQKHALPLLFSLALLPALHAEDWPQWRGPNRDGVWQVDGVLERLPQGQLEAEWSVDIGPGYNGPTVADGRVYVMDRIKEDESERILCLDSKSGKELWAHKYSAPYGKLGYKAGPRASVTIREGKAYAVGSVGHFHCLDSISGEVIWEHDLRSKYKIDMPIWGITASPMIYEELVIQQVGGEGDANMVAFDKGTGKEIWRAINEKAGYSSPVIIQQQGQDVLVCWTGESLSGLNPKTGKLLWRHAMRSVNMPIGIATPSIDGDQIFVSSFYDGSLMIRKSKDALETDLVWRARGESEKRTGSKVVTRADGRVEFDERNYGIHTMIGTPIVQNGYIYSVDSYGEFRCLEAETGKRVWENVSAVPRNRWATIHMVRQADRVWMFNEAGELMIAKLSPNGLEIQSRAKLIEPTRVQLPRRDGVCWSHPAYAEKSIFVRNDNRIIRVSLAK